MNPTKENPDDIRGANGVSYVPRNSSAVPIPKRQYIAPSDDTRAQHYDAAANIARAQADHIYATNPPNAVQPNTVSHKQTADEQITSEQAQLVHQPQHTYDRTLETSAAPEYDWRQYHSAWQHYYQQYYGQYYQKHLEEREKLLQEQVSLKHNDPIAVSSTSDEAVTPTQKLRQDLVKTVKTRAEKVKKSRHFVPIFAALIIGGLFFLLQYNQIIGAQVAAYVTPSGTITDKTLFDPNASTAVSSDPKLIIPKINVEVPVDYTLASTDEAVTEKALLRSVVRYPIPGANSAPGETGNTVILGHSSNNIYDPGAFKYVFVRLDALEKGDEFYLNYQGTRYVYQVTGKEVITPQQVSKLILPNDKPHATLVTCTPIGTSTNRLLIYADQISPDPAAATTNVSAGQSDQKVSIPGNQPTFLESLFGN
jgi:sortase A